MSYNYQDAPSESQSEWLGKKAPELNKNLKPQQFYEWCINLEKRINELEQRQGTGQVETHCYVQERFDAWKEGSVARLKGMKLPDCPYKSRSRKADAWENGWEVTDLNLDCT